MQSQPLLQAELLHGIGNALSNMDEDVKADECFTQVVNLYLQVNKPREAAITLLDQAHVAFAAGDASRAASLVLQAEKVFPNHASDDEFMARYLVTQGAIAATNGNFQKAREWFASALPFTARTFRQNDGRTVFAIRALAEMEAHMGDYSPAIQRLQQLLPLLTKDKEANPVDIQSIVDDLAEFEFQTGRFRASMESFESASDRCAKFQDPAGVECAYTQVRRSRVLLILGYHNNAMDLLPTLMPHTMSTSAKRENTMALLGAFRVLASNNVLDRYPTLSARVKAFEDSKEGNKQSIAFRVEALLVQVQNQLLQQQRQQESQHLLDRAEALMDGQQPKDHQLLGMIKLYKGLLAQSMGQVGTALSLLQAATDEYSATLGAEHPLTLLVSTHQARALWAAHQRDNATAILDHSIGSLQAAMGSDAPNLVKIKALREEIARSVEPGLRAQRQVDILL
jgi:tetratricopeptide (TPR) repeat protein